MSRRRFTALALVCAAVLVACDSGVSTPGIVPPQTTSAFATETADIPATPTAQGTEQPNDLAMRVDGYANGLVGSGFSGALLLASGDKVLLAKGYGVADTKTKAPASVDTVFSTGSVTKQFTAAAILKLEQVGKLSTADPLSKFFDGVPADKAGITLHQLLTHSAGFADSYGEDEVPISRDAALALFFGKPLLFAPGERWSYSNAGYSILAAVIEKDSGRSYEEFLVENLFKPAGMRDTGYSLPGWDPARVAHYPPNRKGLDSLLDRPGPYWHLIGNGGILSTVGDMYRWYQALQSDLLLAKTEREKLFQPYVETGGQGSYGYGWGIATTAQGKRAILHNGGDSLGTSADVRWFPDDGFFIVVLSTGFLDGKLAASQVAFGTQQIIFGEGAASAVHPAHSSLI